MAENKYHPVEWESACDIKNKPCKDEKMDCREYFYEIDSDRQSWDRGYICVKDWFK